MKPQAENLGYLAYNPEERKMLAPYVKWMLGCYCWINQEEYPFLLMIGSILLT